MNVKRFSEKSIDPLTKSSYNYKLLEIGTFHGEAESIASANHIWRLTDVLAEAAAFLKMRGISDPRLNAERMLAHVLGLKRIDLYLQFDRPLNRDERNAYKDLLKRRTAREPLQYILGETEFMSLPFRVGPDVLIPRPETEVLVERVLEDAKAEPVQTILDIGTGSGCIAVSLAVNLPDVRITALDVSKEALETASQNAELNGVQERIHFIRGDIRCGIESDSRFDAAVSNPPYISLDEWDGLEPEIREFEPRSALCDESDGLAFYREIAGKSRSFLQNGGRLYLEVGDGQSGSVRRLLETSGFSGVESFLDFNRIERVVKGTL